MDNNIAREENHVKPYVEKILESRLNDDTTLEEVLASQDFLDLVIAQASARSDFKVVKDFLKKGGGFTGVDDTGLTPVGAAVWNTDIELLKLLINNGADKNQPIKAWRGITPIELVIEQMETKPEKTEQYKEILSLLQFS